MIFSLYQPNLTIYPSYVIPQYFDGLFHTEIGTATLEQREDSLFIINIGSEGRDGVNIELGEAKGFGFSLVEPNPFTAPTGAFKEWTMLGALNGIPQQKLWTEKHEIIERNGKKSIQISFDSSPLGNQMNFIRAYNESGHLLYSNEFAQGVLWEISGNDNNLIKWPPINEVRWDNTCVVLIPSTFYPALTINFPDDQNTSIRGKIARVETGPVEPLRMPEYCNLVESRMKDISEHYLFDEKLIVFEERLPHHVLGSTRYVAQEQGNRLVLENLGNAGTDGVEIDLSAADEFYLGFEPIESNTDNAALELNAVGYSSNRTEISLGTITQKKLPENDEFIIQPDYRELGNPDIIYEVYKEGELVLATTNAQDVRAGRWPIGCGKLSGQNRLRDTPCFYMEYEDDTPFIIDGQNVGGDALLVLANTEASINSLCFFSIQVSGIPKLTIVEEKTSIELCCKIPDCENRALRFDGLGDYLETDSLPLLSDSDFTIEALVFPEDTDGQTGCSGNFDRIFGFGGDRFELGVCDGQLSIVVDNTSANMIAPLNNNQWYHVAATRFGDEINVYLDCELVHTQTSSFNLGTPFRVGRWPGGDAQDENWEGIIDEFRIWDIARNLDQLDEYKNCELTGSEDHLILYYNFNEGIPTGDNTSRLFVPDLTSNGYNGNFFGFNRVGDQSNYVCSGDFACKNCVPDFTWEFIDACGTVQFINESIGSDLNYCWKFDGVGGCDTDEQNPTYQFSEPGVYTVCLIVGNRQCDEQICKEITVEFNDSPPVLSCVGATLMVDCGGTVTPPADISNSICATFLDVEYVRGDGKTFTDPYTENTTLVCIATNNFGSSNCLFQVEVTDNEGPVAMCLEVLEINLTEDCKALITPDMLNNGSFDDCGIQSLKVSKEVIESEELCEFVPITLIVTDGAGNQDDCTTNVIVNDIAPPSLECGADVTLNVSDSVHPDDLGYPNASDNCEFELTWEDEILNGPACPFQIVRTWTAIDLCGNENVCIQNISVLCDACVSCDESLGLSANLIQNGDFSAGNVGFTSDYSYVATGALGEGDYSVRNSTNLVNGEWSNIDHTSNIPLGEFLACDASDNNNDACYRTTIAVDSGRTYTFCAFVNNLVRPGGMFHEPTIGVFINDNSLASLVLPETPDQWALITFPWEADSGSATIEIRATQTGLIGDDFAIDDVAFLECEDPCDVEDETCFTDSLFISTGFNEMTGGVFMSGQYDSYWNVVETEASIVTPRPATVISPFLPGGWWFQPDAEWISFYEDYILNENNEAPDPPHAFERCFCLCSDSSEVNFDFSVLVDDIAEIDLMNAQDGSVITNLITIDNSTLPNFDDPPAIVNTTLPLASGRYCIRANVRNTDNVAMGFNLSGKIKGGNFLKSNCCRQGNIVYGVVYHDEDMDGFRDFRLNNNPPESGMENWTVQLCDMMGNPLYSTTTDQFGFYQFENIPNGNYILKEVVQGGWTQSAPSSITYNVTVQDQSIIANRNFGNHTSVVGVRTIEYLGNIKIAPNPTQGVFLLSFDLPTKNQLTIQLSTIDGKEVFRQLIGQGSNQQKVDISTLPKGVYLITLVDPSGLQWNKKVVKQ